MGRGRAKAKQTKVARELKYQTLSTDFTALERELGSRGDTPPGQTVAYAKDDDDDGDTEDDDDTYVDTYADTYADKYQEFSGGTDTSSR